MPPPPRQPPAPYPDAVLVDISLPQSVREVARVLFAPGSAFQASWARQLEATGVSEGAWQAAPGAPATRDVLMATPPPAAWSYLVGSTPIGSRRSQALVLALEGQALCVEETNHLSMPFGNSFHTALQYYLAAEAPRGCRLRVSFKLVFSRIAPMKGVLTAMVRGEHEKIFDQWSNSLQRHLAGCVSQGRACGHNNCAHAAFPLPRAGPPCRRACQRCACPTAPPARRAPPPRR